MDGRLVGGRYRLLEAHAIGGMASVWRALDEGTGATVAIKRLHPHLLDDGVARERLVREAAAMRSLRHPNIVGVLELVADPSDPALVMEFVPGRTAAESLRIDGPFSEDDALAIGASLADALAAAHERGIVHRDVKPANVLLGDDGRVRLADFGIADDGAGDADLTATDGVVGTLRYLAPERLAGAPATTASDIWSFGAVLAELASGEPLVSSATPADRVAAAAEPVDRPVGVSDALWAIAAPALAIDPADRTVTAFDLADALHAASGTTPDIELAADADPWAATMVVPVPTVEPVVPAQAVPIVRAPEPAPPVVSRLGAPRPAFVARSVALVTAGVLALAFAIAVLATDRSVFDVPAASEPSPPAAAATPAITVAPTDPPAEAADEGDGEGRGQGKGKGKGRGKGDD